MDSLVSDPLGSPYHSVHQPHSVRELDDLNLKNVPLYVQEELPQ